MDEENKQEQQNDGHEAKPASERGGSRPHVQVFGMDVNTPEDHGGADWHVHKDEWKREHREQRDQERAEQREQWKARREQWRHDHHHGGGLFFGMIVLFVGVVALLYTMGLVSREFWHVILPFWPILLILWGTSIILGRHWFGRFIVFILAFAFLVAVIFYGLVKTDSPVVSYLSPTVVAAIQSAHAQY